jgi:hypothetical protein
MLRQPWPNSYESLKPDINHRWRDLAVGQVQHSIDRYGDFSSNMILLEVHIMDALQGHSEVNVETNVEFTTHTVNHGHTSAQEQLLLVDLAPQRNAAPRYQHVLRSFSGPVIQR